MYRPLHFPDELWARVEIARATADAEFHSIKRSRNRDRERALFSIVIVPVFFTFAHQLCQAVRDGRYSINWISADLQEFRRTLSIELHPDRNSATGWEWFDDEVREAIERSPKWPEHLRERAAAADEHLKARGGAAGEHRKRERRLELLASYKATTGARVEARIYEAVKVHKSEFLKWKKGVLPAESVISARIEAFLKAMKPPRRSED